jgi:protein AFG1
LPNRKLKVWGRELKVPISTGTVARFTFKELCDGPMSAADYLEITKKFETIFVVDIPKMSFSERDKVSHFLRVRRRGRGRRPD